MELENLEQALNIVEYSNKTREIGVCLNNISYIDEYCNKLFNSIGLNWIDDYNESDLI